MVLMPFGYQVVGPTNSISIALHARSPMPLTTTCCSQIAVADPFIAPCVVPVCANPQTLAHMHLSIELTRSKAL